jgi:hypothetical protein
MKIKYNGGKDTKRNIVHDRDVSGSNVEAPAKHI